MWPFKKKGDVETKVAELDTALSNSFERVRDDMTNVTSWLNYIYSQEAERQQALASLQNQVWQLAARQQTVPAVQQPWLYRCTPLPELGRQFSRTRCAFLPAVFLQNL